MYLHTEIITTTHVPASTSGSALLLDGNKELAIARGRALRAEAFRTGFERLGTALAALFAAPRRMLARQATANALRGLDSHLLADIGVDPHNIEGAVDRFRGKSGPGPITKLVAALGRVVASYRSQSTIAELHRMDSRVLADIGIERGDIAQLAEQIHGLAPKPATRVLVAANDDPHAEREVA